MGLVFTTPAAAATYQFNLNYIPQFLIYEQTGAYSCAIASGEFFNEDNVLSRYLKHVDKEQYNRRKAAAGHAARASCRTFQPWKGDPAKQNSEGLSLSTRT